MHNYVKHKKKQRESYRKAHNIRVVRMICLHLMYSIIDYPYILLRDNTPGSLEKELLDERSTVNQPLQFFHVQAEQHKSHTWLE